MISIELEITLRCNRACDHCNRFCNVLPCLSHADSDMSLEQIQQFCSDLTASASLVHHVNVVGGEPLLHPQFESVVNMLYTQLRMPRHIRKLHMTTNGDKLKKADPATLSKFDTITVDWNKQEFVAMLVAPKDTRQKQRHCNVPSHCGFACNAYGYWPCGPGGAIARLLGEKKYRLDHFPMAKNDFEEEDHNGNYKNLCQMCQWSAKKRLMVSEHPEPSKTFKEALDAYENTPQVWSLDVRNP